MKKIAFIVALVFGGVVSMAQSYKVAYVDADVIMNLHPKLKSIESTLAVERKQHEGKIAQMQGDYQQKITAYQSPMTSELEKSELGRQIAFLEQNIQQYSQDAQMELMKKQQELLKPVEESIMNAIDAVAKTKGYDYVLNQSLNGSSVILYVKRKKEDNLTLEVMRNLGIPISAEIQAEYDKL